MLQSSWILIACVCRREESEAAADQESEEEAEMVMVVFRASASAMTIATASPGAPVPKPQQQPMKIARRRQSHPRQRTPAALSFVAVLSATASGEAKAFSLPKEGIISSLTKVPLKNQVFFLLILFDDQIYLIGTHIRQIYWIRS